MSNLNLESKMKYITICGNFRNKDTQEYAGTAFIKNGQLECTANLSDDEEESEEMFDIIQEEFNKGERRGKIVRNDGVLFRWLLVDADE